MHIHCQKWFRYNIDNDESLPTWARNKLSNLTKTSNPSQIRMKTVTTSIEQTSISNRRMSWAVEEDKNDDEDNNNNSSELPSDKPTRVSSTIDLGLCRSRLFDHFIGLAGSGAATDLGSKSFILPNFDDDEFLQKRPEMIFDGVRFSPVESQDRVKPKLTKETLKINQTAFVYDSTQQQANQDSTSTGMVIDANATQEHFDFDIPALETINGHLVSVEDIPFEILKYFSSDESASLVDCPNLIQRYVSKMKLKKLVLPELRDCKTSEEPVPLHKLKKPQQQSVLDYYKKKNTRELFIEELLLEPTDKTIIKIKNYRGDPYTQDEYYVVLKSQKEQIKLFLTLKDQDFVDFIHDFPI
ncbi:unnamed protein product [Brachionus calyciflorus]|uniref:Uncharacterized protein n=1 Tax=Brachionus calyciflorus TaxID=104777 RepID=A0A813ZHP5_9BILA|nr:unnamed protein product [Brachionus calyciflorus]